MARFPEPVLGTIHDLKNGVALQLPVLLDGRPVGTLEPVTWKDAADAESVARLASWREAAADGFPSQFPVTVAGTQRWLLNGVLQVPDRLLFWVRTNDGLPVGHVGLYRYDSAARTIEIDNIVRGESAVAPGIMYGSVRQLADWTFETLGMSALFLRVFSDNARALRLYERCGFYETMRMPLKRVVEGEVIRWLEVNSDYRELVTRYFVTMRLPYRCAA
jgi:RimJ/RimL family protein N-acetyltransferase